MAKRPSRGTKYRRDLGRKIKKAVDLFTLDEKNYLVTVDYYSAGLLGAGLRPHSTEAGAVIKKLKAHFARHGSLCQLVSENGPQFDTAEFQNFKRA